MWAAALRGADCVYVTYYPDLAFPGASAEAAGRDIAYVPVSAQEYAAALAEHMPSDEALLLTDLFAGVLDGRNAHLSRGVRRALGRLPRDFADFAADTAASGVWEA